MEKVTKARMHIVLDHDLDQAIRRIGKTKFGSGRNISHTIKMMLEPVISNHLEECQSIEQERSRQMRQALDIQAERLNNDGLNRQYVQNLEGLTAF